MSFFIPSASATVVNGTSYDWKVYQGQLNLSEYPDSSFSQYNYITVGCDDWKLSGYGYFGYDKSIDSFYVQIDKYAGANGSWVLKLDSDKYWKYRDGLNDYGSMSSTWHSMKTEPKDIYVTFGGIDLNDSNDTWWIDKCFTYSPTETYTITFTGDGVTTFTKQVAQMESFTFPDYTRTGYKLKRWQVVGSSIWYNVGDTIPAYGNETFIAEWERVSPCTLTFTGEGVTTFTEQVDIGEDFTFPDYSRAGYVLERWKVKNSSTWYDVGETVTPLADVTFEAVWRERQTFVLTFTGQGITTFTKEVVEGEQFTFPDYTRAGYKLFRWYVSDSAIWYEVGETVTPLASLTFIAEWEKDGPCLLTFTGDGVETFTIEVEQGKSFTFPNYTRKGYDLERWKVKDVNIFYDVGENVTPLSNETFVAVWKAKTVMFQGDGFEPFELPCELDGMIIMPALPEGTTREGYTFKGWTDGVKKYFVGEKVDCSLNDIWVFTAIWEESLSYDDGYQDGMGPTFLGKFLNELFDGLKDAIKPLWDYELPILEFSVGSLVKTITSICVILVLLWLANKVRK